MFEPEKVKLFSLGGHSLEVGEEAYAHKVLMSDYTQLLELYREQKAVLERLDKECLIGCLSLPTVRIGVEL